MGLHAATELSTGRMAHGDGTVAAISTAARAQPHLTPAAVACPPTFGNEGPMSGSSVDGGIFSFPAGTRPRPAVELVARTGTFSWLAGDGMRSSVMPDPAGGGRGAECSQRSTDFGMWMLQARTTTPFASVVSPSTDELKQNFRNSLRREGRRVCGGNADR